jgi:hypothetical protein
MIETPRWSCRHLILPALGPVGWFWLWSALLTIPSPSSALPYPSAVQVFPAGQLSSADLGTCACRICAGRDWTACSVRGATYQLLWQRTELHPPRTGLLTGCYRAEKPARVGGTFCHPQLVRPSGLPVQRHVGAVYADLDRHAAASVLVRGCGMGALLGRDIGYLSNRWADAVRLAPVPVGGPANGCTTRQELFRSVIPLRDLSAVAPTVPSVRVAPRVRWKA